MKSLFTLFLAISASIFPLNAFAGAWLQDEGRGEIITTTRFYGTGEFFDNHGDKKSIPVFTKTEVAPYFEYGASDKITLGGEFDVAASTNGSAQFGDSFDFQTSYGSVFARAYLFKSYDLVASIEPGIDFPFRINPDLTSDGDHPIPELKLSVGYGYERWEQNNFVDASVKYRYRDFGNLNDMVKSEFVVGYHLTDYFIGIAQISNEKTLGSTNSAGNYNLTKPQLSILYDEREHWAQQYGVFANVSGRNSGAGYGAIYSLWYRF